MSAPRSLYGETDSARRFKLQEEDSISEEGRSEFRRDFGRILHSPSFRRLAGKTQLFPVGESDFFRNRLTHSLEVAQIAKGIATIINKTDPYFQQNPISLDLIECAALAHDIGHPPFGHNGEEALNECMNGSGGFEGNAQTLRIVARLEKREIADIQSQGFSPSGQDMRVGLNLTARTMAAMLKYDRQIPEPQENNPSVKKGYYAMDASVVRFIKKNVCGVEDMSDFKTVECCIMDIADDIAYSTYDLEDAMKGGFAHPLQIVASTDELKQKIVGTIKDRAKKFYPDCESEWKDFNTENVGFILEELFGKELSQAVANERSGGTSTSPELFVAAASFNASAELASNGYIRVKLTSSFVKRFMSGVEVTLNQEFPQLTRVRLDFDTFLKVEVLKNFAYQAFILSSMLKTSEFRGKDIVDRIFKAFDDKSALMLLPEDYRALLTEIPTDAVRRRVICDYVAGMTDRYAMEVYRRLYSTDPPSMFKPP